MWKLNSENLIGNLFRDYIFNTPEKISESYIVPVKLIKNMTCQFSKYICVSFLGLCVFHRNDSWPPLC